MSRVGAVRAAFSIRAQAGGDDTDAIFDTEPQKSAETGKGFGISPLSGTEDVGHLADLQSLAATAIDEFDEEVPEAIRYGHDRVENGAPDDGDAAVVVLDPIPEQQVGEPVDQTTGEHPEGMAFVSPAGDKARCDVPYVLGARQGGTSKSFPSLGGFLWLGFKYCARIIATRLRPD